jgi:hypothetical protein
VPNFYTFGLTKNGSVNSKQSQGKRKKARVLELGAWIVTVIRRKR